MQKFENTLHKSMENLNVTEHRLIKWLLFVQSNVYKDTSNKTKVFYMTSLN